MMGVSQVAASRAGRGMLTVPRDANDAVEGLAVAVVGGDDVLVARIRAAFAREGVAAHVRWPVAHADPGARAPDVVVLAVPPDHAAAPAVDAVRRRLPRAQVVLALAPGVCARGAGQAIHAAPDGVVADADLDVALGMVVRCARAGYVAFPASAGERDVRPAFSPRERQIVRLVVLGLTNDEIAHRLFLAKSTVAGHLTAVFRRLGVRSRRELVAAVLGGDEDLRRTFLAVALPGEHEPGWAGGAGMSGAAVEPASTVYALACVLVACLTGAPPFAHERPLLTLHAHLTAPPPAVSSRARGLPREIDEVVVAALAKAPADRPRSPERLMRAVQRALATSAPIPVAAPRARPTGKGAAPDAQTPARARPGRRRPRRAAPRRRRRLRGRMPSWRAALVGAASLVVLSGGFGAGTLAGDVHAAGPAAAPGPTVAQRRAAVRRLDLAMARLSTRRALARARLRRARDAHAEADQATALADAYAAARRVAVADATATAAGAGAAPVVAHLATAEHAYRRLARAATRHDRRGFASAAREVVAAERALDAATA
jgi:DNA-binding NarL/FixJ family response regulator